MAQFPLAEDQGLRTLLHKCMDGCWEQESTQMCPLPLMLAGGKTGGKLLCINWRCSPRGKHHSGHLWSLHVAVSSFHELGVVLLSLCWDLHFQFVFSNDSGGCFQKDVFSWTCFPCLIPRAWACLISQGWRFQQLPGAPWRGSKEGELTCATQKSPYFKGYPVSPLQQF